MSLLLDALRKSGSNSTPGAGLTLEEPSPPPTAPSPSAPGRAAGETLFAAKKKKRTGGGWKLGLVPTTLLIALIFGSGYGYYVWLELQPPPSQRMAPHPAPPAPRSVAPLTAAAPALVPFIPPQEKTAPASPAQPLITAGNEDFDMPRPRSRAARPRAPAAGEFAVQRKQEADTITPLLLGAYQAYQRGDYVTAAQGYQQVLGQDAHNHDALLGLASIARQQGRDEEAQRYYRKLLALDPRDPAAQTALMAYAPDEGNRESRLKLLLAEQPRSGTLNFALGNYYAEQSGWGDAQQYYFNALTLEPTNAQFAFNLAVSLDHLGQRKLAAQYYQQALQLDVSGHSGFDRAQAQQRLNELTTAR